MRQALFVIAVVGAAFAGGALVNGPGFRWAQERLLLYMGLQDGGEIASIDLPPAPGEAPIADAPTVDEASPAVSKRDPEVKTASADSVSRRALDQGIPAPKTEPRATEPFDEAGADKPAVEDDDEAERSGSPALLGALVGALKQTAPPPGSSDGPTQEPEPRPEPEAAPAPLDPSVAPALLASLSPSSQGSEPTPESDSASKDVPTTDESGDWTELRGKLGEVGVSRYTIEGEPGGRVVFVCLIPLAGKQAVSQRFEAEGDDEFQAARAALRRINLWRAAQAAPSK